MSLFSFINLSIISRQFYSYSYQFIAELSGENKSITDPSIFDYIYKIEQIIKPIFQYNLLLVALSFSVLFFFFIKFLIIFGRKDYKTQLSQLCLTYKSSQIFG